MAWIPQHDARNTARQPERPSRDCTSKETPPPDRTRCLETWSTDRHCIFSNPEICSIQFPSRLSFCKAVKAQIWVLVVSELSCMPHMPHLHHMHLCRATKATNQLAEIHAKATHLQVEHPQGRQSTKRTDITELIGIQVHGTCVGYHVG